MFAVMVLKKPPASPLLFSILLVIFSTLASSSSLRNATRRPGSPHPRAPGTIEDYDNYYNEPLSAETTPKAAKPTGSPPPLCHYDLCQEQQESCQQMALTLGCFCPGISGLYESPDPPHLRSLSLEGAGTVVVHWCAPASMVTHYLVQVEGQDEGRQAGEKRRLMELVDVAPGTEVCVRSVNRAGTSVRASRSCARFEPRSSEFGLAVKLGLIGGAVALVVVLVLALLIWKCRRHRKTPPQTVNRGSEVVL